MTNINWKALQKARDAARKAVVSGDAFSATICILSAIDAILEARPKECTCVDSDGRCIATTDGKLVHNPRCPVPDHGKEAGEWIKVWPNDHDLRKKIAEVISLHRTDNCYSTADLILDIFREHKEAT